MCEIMENMIAEAVNEASNEEKTKAVINMLRLKMMKMKSENSILLNLKKVREDSWKSLIKTEYC